LICYCDAVGATPHSIVRRDDNGVVLFALRNGGTIDELRKGGIAVTESQLSLLLDWQLVKRRGALYTTTMPLIDDSTLSAIQSFVDPLAADFVRSHAAMIRTLVEIITAAGLSEQQYAVLFSYVLDGQMWRKLDTDGALPATRPDRRHPFWNGAFWAVQAKRLVPGTNTSTRDGVTTYRTWNDLSDKAVSAYPAARVPPPSFPDKAGTPVHDQGKLLADALATLIQQAAATSAFPALRATPHPVITLILGHEIIWAAMNQIVHDGLVAEPPALRDQAPSTEAVKALIFSTTP
jgi:hypothetical protein